MRIDILSVVPELLESPLSHSIIKRAREKGVVEIHVHNIRDWSKDKHRKVDDYSFGGDAGLVMTVQPVFDCINELKARRPYDEIIYTAPDAPTFTQRMANELSLKENIMILCGHYKGVDQRVRDHLVTREISVGDYVLTGGELPACVMTDAIVRLLPGAMGDETSALSDSLRQADLKGLVGQAEQVAAQMDSLLMKINKGEGTVGAFVKDSDLYYNLSEASENLNRFLVEFRHNPKKFIRLSLVDFSSNKSDVGEYAVVIRETTERLAANDSLYRKHSGLCEIRHRDKYLYVVDTYKKLKQAQKKLAEVADEYENAYIVRVDFY